MMKEKILYEPIRLWLEKYLKNKYSEAKVLCLNTSTFFLSRVLENKNLLREIPLAETFDVKVDITGILFWKKKVELVIVEVKKGKISIMGLAQSLGYSRIINPLESFLISPKGWSSKIDRLIRIYKRKDLLFYSEDRYIQIAKWNLLSSDVRKGDILW